MKIVDTYLHKRKMKTIFEKYLYLLKYGDDQTPVLMALKILTDFNFKNVSKTNYFVDFEKNEHLNTRMILYPKSMYQIDKNVINALSQYQSETFMYHSQIMFEQIIFILNCRAGYKTSSYKYIGLRDKIKEHRTIYAHILNEYCMLCSIKIMLEENNLFNIYCLNVLGTFNIELYEYIRNSEIISEQFTDFIKSLNTIQPKLIKLISDDLNPLYKILNNPKDIFSNYKIFESFEHELHLISPRIRFLTCDINNKITKLIESIEFNIFQVDSLYSNIIDGI